MSQIVKALYESDCELNKTWANKCRELYNKSTKSTTSLEKNNIKMYSTYKSEKSVVAKDLLELCKKNYKYLTSISKMCLLLNQII